jgi:enolase
LEPPAKITVPSFLENYPAYKKIGALDVLKLVSHPIVSINLRFDSSIKKKKKKFINYKKKTKNLNLKKNIYIYINLIKNYPIIVTSYFLSKKQLKSNYHVNLFLHHKPKARLFL